jgi:Uma2 family endonuclease
MANVESPNATHGSSLVDSQDGDWLENGEMLDQKTFHERYLKTPEGFRAELIGGIVYVMSSPLWLEHALPDVRIITLLGLYMTMTPGTEAQSNATTILGDDSEVQPDCSLRIRAECGGQCGDSPGTNRCILGAPELVVEVALSSRSIDLGAKSQDYERAGVREYVVYDAIDTVVRWFTLVDGRFQSLAADTDGVIRSRVFPGLWFNANAFYRDDHFSAYETLMAGLASPEHAAFIAALERRRAGAAGEHSSQGAPRG